MRTPQMRPLNTEYSYTVHVLFILTVLVGIPEQLRMGRFGFLNIIDFSFILLEVLEGKIFDPEIF